MYIFLLILGIALLIFGADKLIDAITVLSKKWKIPKQILGLSLMSLGTSLPELVISFRSMIEGSGEIVIGNVVGSNIQDILLILGLAAVIRPFSIKTDTIKKEIPILILTTLVFAICTQDILLDGGIINYINRQEGMLIVLFFSIFIYYIVKHTKYGHELNPEPVKIKYNAFQIVFFIILGSACLILGSSLVVENASLLALKLGVSEYLVSLTVIALGTSLPELVTTVIAAKKGETELAVGNLIGSCIIDICLVVGLPISLFGSVVLDKVTGLDIAVMLMATVLVYIFSRSEKKISRMEGIIFLILFLVYYSIVIWGGLHGV